VLEELDGNNNEEAEAQRRAILEAGELPKKEHPKKRPKNYPRGTYSAMPDPPVPITE